MKSKQLIALQRLKVFVSLETPAEMTPERESKLLTLIQELKQLGFTLSAEAIWHLSEEDMVDIHNEVLPHLHNSYYPSTKWVPLYPGFPEQVLSMDEVELFKNQRNLYDTMDYEGFLKNNPWTSKEEKEDIVAGRITELGAMTEADLLGVFKSILASGSSLAPATREELIWFLENYPNAELPKEIPFKETKSIVMSYRKDYEVSDVNDVLRFGIFAMGGNPVLIQVPKKVKSVSWSRYANMDNPEWRDLKATRKTRVEVLERLETCLNKKGLAIAVADAKKFYGHWLVLSERIHPGDYETRFPKAFGFFRTLKSSALSKKFRTWNSKLQNMYNSKRDLVDIAKFISTRPGELVRRFDSLLRAGFATGHQNDITDVFLETDGMKNKTLIELRSYYDRRSFECPRLISIKGKGTITHLPPLQPLPEEVVDTVQTCIERKIVKNIIESVGEQDLTGKYVYLDPDIKSVPIPKNMRSSAFAIPQCSRFDIPEDKNVIRMFIHWIQNPAGPAEDLDLHAYLYKNASETRNVGWNTGLRQGDCVAHSGDVLNRPGDCAEYVDIDINKALAEGWKYVVMDVHNYKGRKFTSLPCWLGYTFMSKVQGGEKGWSPKNVEFSREINALDCTSIAAWLFDLEKRQAVFLGIDLDTIPINVGNLQDAIVQYFSVTPTFTCYQVLEEYYKARGAVVVNDPTVAECEISVTQRDVVTDYTKVLEILA